MKLTFTKKNHIVEDENKVKHIEPSTAVQPEGSNGVYALKATRISQAYDDTRKLVYSCHTGLTVDIPTGYVGLLVSPPTIAITSLALTTGANVIMPGDTQELVMHHKITTDVAPRVFTVGDVVAWLMVVPVDVAENIEVLEDTTTELPKEEVEETNEPQTEA